jgi:hypothetical protein
MAKLRRRHGAVRLSEAEIGHSYEVMRVYEKDPKFLEFLVQLDLRPSARLRVHQREYDETMALSVAGRRGGARVHLGKTATQRIWVRRLAG